MRSKAGMKFDCILEEALDFIEIDYTHLNKTIRYEQRPHGEWIYKRQIGDCSSISYNECSNCKCKVNILDVFFMNFCPKCGASMQANDGQVTGKLNSEIEKSKSEIVPDTKEKNK